mmetsp:Transcript_67390/g.213314  ORF Transcript_67390/g.213314 Transcript_67390/m.213314 type:complete len:208 (+) Transcript_67390:224-847(+)
MTSMIVPPCRLRMASFKLAIVTMVGTRGHSKPRCTSSAIFTDRETYSTCWMPRSCTSGARYTNGVAGAAAFFFFFVPPPPAFLPFFAGIDLGTSARGTPTRAPRSLAGRPPWSLGLRGAHCRGNETLCRLGKAGLLSRTPRRGLGQRLCQAAARGTKESPLSHPSPPNPLPSSKHRHHVGNQDRRVHHRHGGRGAALCGAHGALQGW